MTNDLKTIGANFVCDVDSMTVGRFTIPENFSDIIVVWSGGCDSTALVLYLWEKYHKTINLVSIDYDRFGSSSNDLKSRNKLFKIFKKRNIDVTYQEIIIRDTIAYDEGVVLGLSQPQIFLSALANLIRGENKLICFGYIHDDDLWHYIDCFGEIFNNINKLTHSNSHLYMPFEWISKEKILWYLHEHKLLNDCNYCQYSFDRKPCNNCASCEKHNSALKNCRRFKWKYFRLSN